MTACKFQLDETTTLRDAQAWTLNRIVSIEGAVTEVWFFHRTFEF